MRWRCCAARFAMESAPNARAAFAPCGAIPAIPRRTRLCCRRGRPHRLMLHNDTACERNDAAVVRFPLGTRLLVKLLYLSRRFRGLHRYDDFVVERVHGAPILVIPTVFNPKRLRTGEFFASRLDAALIDPSAEVLDMGTGSG